MSTADGDSLRPADSPVPLEGAGDEPTRPSAATAPASEPGLRGCPFLVASDGGWRLDMPSRDHRCAAFAPPAALAPEKQQRLCLTPAHASCATYLASVTARTERLGAAPVRRATRWGLARTTSVIEDPGGIRGRLLAAVLDRRRWPAIPAVLLVATLITLALSGFRAGTPPTAVATASPVPPGPSPTARATPLPSPTALATAGPTLAPSATPAGTVGPSATFRTYRVNSGDTLGAIASQFGVTVKAIMALNGIEDPARLQVGKVLLIP